MKKTLAILLALTLVLCMMPSAAFATSLNGGEIVSVAVAEIPAQTYTGSEIRPEPVVTAVVKSSGDVNTQSTVTLVKGTDYTVTYNNNTNIGVNTASVTVDFIGEFDSKPDETKYFTINALDLSSTAVTVTEKNAITDLSSASTKVVVKYGNDEITNLVDIKAAISPSDSGTVLVTISAKENDLNIIGTKTEAFYIKTVFDSSYKATASDMVYTGQPRIPSLTFWKNNSRITLSEGTDYTVSYSDNVNKGACVMTFTGIGKYTGTFQSTFNITPKSISSVKISIPNVPQNGTIAPVLTDGTKTLIEGTDYTYAKPVNTSVAGTKTLVITGLNNYTGTQNVTYTVIDANKVFNDSNVTVASYIPYYNGSKQYQTITVKIGNTVLNNGTDYKVEYTLVKNGKTTTNSYAQDAGTYTVNITGIGSYSGTAVKTFSIAPVSLDYAEIVLSNSTTTYGGYTVPKVNVRHVTGNFYFPESDYTVSYRYLGYSSTYLKPVAVIVPNLNGNLIASVSKTELTKEINYNARSISNCNVYFTDHRSSKAYDGTIAKPSVVVKDYSLNKTLVLNSDYTVTYKDAAGKTVSGFKDAGTYTVVITGIGAYSGTTSLTYTINGIDISGYTVTLKESSVKADGYSKTPVILSVKNGYYTTLSSADYTVAYEDAAGKTVYSMSTPGTYKVVVTGKNGYSGSTYATFRIVGTPQEIKIAKTSYKVYKDSDSFKINATATGDGTGFSYVSSNPEVATVSATGVVTIHKIGRAKITVTTTGMKKSEPASDDVYVKVYPDKTKITQKPQTEGNKASFRVRWEKQDDVTYYEIRYARNSKFTSGTYLTKKVNASTLNYTTQSTKVTGLKSGARYYVKVRAVKVVTNDYGQQLKYYGTWSNWRSVVTK
ncbi:MAG: fibronectin type III domain-containing protein [Anaerovoracaceae bacterium]